MEKKMKRNRHLLWLLMRHDALAWHDSHSYDYKTLE